MSLTRRRFSLALAASAALPALEWALPPVSHARVEGRCPPWERQGLALAEQSVIEPGVAQIVAR